MGGASNSDVQRKKHGWGAGQLKLTLEGMKKEKYKIKMCYYLLN